MIRCRLTRQFVKAIFELADHIWNRYWWGVLIAMVVVAVSVWLYAMLLDL